MISYNSSNYNSNQVLQETVEHLCCSWSWVNLPKGFKPKYKFHCLTDIADVPSSAHVSAIKSLKAAPAQSFPFKDLSCCDGSVSLLRQPQIADYFFSHYSASTLSLIPNSTSIAFTFLCASISKDPCLNHHCKKGKVCEADEGNTPICVCQDPTSCPAAEGQFEHVSLTIPTTTQTTNAAQTPTYKTNIGFGTDFGEEGCRTSANLRWQNQELISNFWSHTATENVWNHSSVTTVCFYWHFAFSGMVFFLFLTKSLNFNKKKSLFCRSAAPTTRPTRPPASSLPPSAPWREPRRDTSCTWTMWDPANVNLLRSITPF